MTALRYNAGKPELSYLLSIPKAVEALCKVFSQGAIKYERDNWQKGGKPNQEYLDSALRHLFAFTDDHWDTDTGCMHLAHAIWNLAALIELNTGTLPVFDPTFDQTSFEEHYAKDPTRP